MALPNNNVDEMVGTLRESLEQSGFEAYPLKVGWYNAVVSPALHLPYPEDTLALVVLSTPSMFERTFLPFLQGDHCSGLLDPIDQCVAHTISSCVQQCLPEQLVDMCFDYEILPNRKPRFLAQTAAHVAGAAFYYQPCHVSDLPKGAKKMFGVCVHPRLGGWFAIRALLVLRDVEPGAELQQVAPPDCVKSQEGRLELLQRFNLHWQDWSYRDIIPTVDSYSPQQREYFITHPTKRGELLRKWGLLMKGNGDVEITEHN